MGKILQFAAILTLFALLLCYLAAYVSPATIWILEVFALGYLPVLLVTILVAFLCYLANERIYIAAIILVLLGYNLLRSHIQLAPSKVEPENAGLPVKVMSFNARLFNLYNWTENIQTKKEIYQLIQEEEPEILCIQEFYTSRSNGQNNLQALKKLKAKNEHVAYTATSRKNEHWGIATFTSYPILNKGEIPFNESTNNTCIYTDIKIKTDTIRVYNVHFQSNSFVKEDYDFLDKPNEPKQTNKITASVNILRRIKQASVKRAKQVDLVKAHMEQSPYPILLCGDFNDTPASYTYHQVSQNLKDSFKESGRGFGNTLTGFAMAPLRTDYILHAGEFASFNFKIIQQKLSDHYPITTIIDLRPEVQQKAE